MRRGRSWCVNSWTWLDRFGDKEDQEMLRCDKSRIISCADDAIVVDFVCLVEASLLLGPEIVVVAAVAK